MFVVAEEDWRALGRHADAWNALAAAALVSNPFQEPWMLQDALETFGSGSRLVLAFVYLAQPAGSAPLLCGVFPLERTRRYRVLAAWRVWRHPFCYLCTPLVRREHAQRALGTLLCWVRGRGGAFVEFQLVDGEGPFARALEASYAGRPHAQDYRYERACLRPGSDADAYLREVLSADRRKRLRRQERRLAALGKLEYAELQGEPAQPWLDEFVRLEAAGWKGRRGVALRCDARRLEFFMRTAREAQMRGRLGALALRLDGRALAMQIYLVAGRTGFALKTAYDEAYGDYSPGMLLQLAWVARLHEHRQLEGVDSCSSPGSAMELAWGERRAMTWILSGNSPLGDWCVRALPALRSLKRRAKSLHAALMQPARNTP